MTERWPLFNLNAFCHKYEEGLRRGVVVTWPHIVKWSEGNVLNVVDLLLTGQMPGPVAVDLWLTIPTALIAARATRTAR